MSERTPEKPAHSSFSHFTKKDWEQFSSKATAGERVLLAIFGPKSGLVGKIISRTADEVVMLRQEESVRVDGFKEQVKDVLGSITEQERGILRLRFGLDTARDMTREEVSHQYEVTREQIRQIEAKALRKLRHPSRTRKLKTYLE